MLKVSVVVASYRPGPGLDRLFASLDAQTMSTTDFEIIVVDDGSPDDTYKRLVALRASRPHLRVERIENSGWPSRPRNIGTGLARGEYVAYMDHDDELYPDALRAAYEFARANHSDVVSGKEARTHDAGWAIDLYRADEGDATGMTRQHPMIPMNPHKLYRRAFLQEHGIRFPEGGRVMWEDIFFNMHVARHAQTVSVLASVPYYHWFTTKGSGSTGFTRSSPDFWVWLRRLFEATEEILDGEEYARQRVQLMTHQYRTRVLASFDTRFSGRPPEEQALIYSQSRALQADFDLGRFESDLPSSSRLRAHLLRQDQRALLADLAHTDPMIPGWGALDRMEWDGDALRLQVDVRWSSPQGRRPALRRAEDGRLHKALPDRLAAAVPRGLCDVTEEVTSARIELGMRSRETRVVWMLPSQGTVQVSDDGDDGVEISGRLAAVLDLRSAVFGAPAGPDTWDLNVRTTLGGWVSQQALRADLDTVVGLTHGELHIAFVNADGFVSVLADGTTEAPRRMAPAGVERHDARRVSVALAGVHSGTGTVTVMIDVDAHRGPTERFIATPAEFTVQDGRATVTFTAPASAFRIRLGDRLRDAPRWWTVDGTALGRGPARRTPSENKRPSLRHTVGRLLRRAGLRG